MTKVKISFDDMSIIDIDDEYGYREIELSQEEIDKIKENKKEFKYYQGILERAVLESNKRNI